ncbi:hypothetical protein EFJ78_04560 [Pediococcus pentosaceus]|nr:hypothetical protein [Pediococcus pentosaceus]MCS8567406.1 hypothetical protein [Pediococcus pentosaceus]MCS8580947.1 hypothetical protein [Pediococcus pentosaceus]
MLSSNSTNVSTTPRGGEIALGILGGVFGIIASLFETVVGGMGSSLGSGDGGLGGLAIGMFIVCVLAIILPFFINRKRVLVGWLIIACGVLNFVFAGGFGILSGILIVIAGILALSRK